jgi:hypothetical protein
VAGCNTVQLFLLRQLPEVLVAKLAGRGLDAQALASGMGCDITTAEVKLQPVPLGDLRDKLTVSIGFDSAQLVIEVDRRKNDAEFLPYLQHDSQQSYRVSSTRNGDAHPVPGLEKIPATDVVEDTLRHRMH